MNRAEIVAELERIAALLGDPECDGDRAEARRGLEALSEALRLGDECPFEPGQVRLMALQSRSEPLRPRKLNKKKKTRKPAKAPARGEVKPRRSSDGRPLTGRIAAMVRDGVPTEEILTLYRVKPEHAEAFVSAFVDPARPDRDGAGSGTGALSRCPTPP